MIDDYEEQVVENFKINKLREVLKLFRDRTILDEEEANVITAMERLSVVALRKKMSIFFIL